MQGLIASLHGLNRKALIALLLCSLALPAVIFVGGIAGFKLRLIAAILSIATLALTSIATRKKYLFAFAAVVLLSLITLFTLWFFYSRPTPTSRLLIVGMILLNATCLSVLLLHLAKAAKASRILITICFFGSLFIWEMILGSLPYRPAAVWSGFLDSNDVLSNVYRPDSELKTLYDRNPRGYFEQDNVNGCWLRLGETNHAHMEFENTAAVRIDIENASTVKAYDIQLNFPGYSVREGEKYQISFLARADAARNIFVGFAMAQSPWSGLGLYDKTELTEKWKQFTQVFRCNGNERSARIHFDVGGDSPSVEISSITLKRAGEDFNIAPLVPAARYAITYRFNHMGCRGRDYTIPRRSNTQRLLLLGDANALGEGVKQEDTIASQLEVGLNAQAKRYKSNTDYEVVNCGTAGYGLEESRLFYEMTASKYQAQTVLLLVPSFTEQQIWATKADRLFFVLSTETPLFLPVRSTPGSTMRYEEILRIRQAAQRNGARLVVLFYRLDPDYEGKTNYGKIWNNLQETIKRTIRGTNIAMMDLGPGLLKDHTYEELMVYPKLDAHLNEVAHRIAAKEVEDFLFEKQILH